jgi:hypothetical protein
MDATAAPSTKFVNRTIIAPLGPIARYHLHNVLLLTAVPFLCGIVLLMLLTVFAKLNLYYLEANGLLIDEQVRDAYYSQVQTETLGVGGYLLLQLAVTAVVSVIVMRWASAPFQSATRVIETALTNPSGLKPVNRWLSESPFFDRIIWLFALRVKNGGENQVKDSGGRFTANIFFLLKFWATFATLSIATGYFMGIIISTVYERIISLALALVRAKNMSASQHFFEAQQDILHDATTITTIVSLIVFFLIGLRISRYMSTMLFVFARALEEDRFPVQLRTDDVYHALGTIMNRAREKIR